MSLPFRRGSRVKSRGSEKFEIIFPCVYTDSSRCLAMFNDVFTFCIYTYTYIYVYHQKKAIRTNHEIHWSSYRRLRNAITMKLRKEKENYYTKQLYICMYEG